MSTAQPDRFGSFPVAACLAVFLLVVVSACGDSGTGDCAKCAFDATADLASRDSVGDALQETTGREPDAPGQDAAPEIVPPGIVRFVHFSDLHCEGTPENPAPCDIPEGAAQIGKEAADAALAIATGDIADSAPDKYNGASETPWTVAAGLLSSLSMPWAGTPGNHDYYAGWNPIAFTADKQARTDTIAAALSGTHFSQDINGIRFIGLNSLTGETWDVNIGLVGSFSDEELEWLENELAPGVPSLLFLHHPPSTTSPTGDQPSLCDVINAHPGVIKGIFSGHLHQFIRGQYCGVPSYVVGHFNPGSPFYYYAEYDGPADVLTILNEADLPFATVPALECVPGEEVVEDVSPAIGTFQHLDPENLNAPQAQDVGRYVGEIFDAIPTVIHVDGVAEDGKTVHARLTLASRWSDVEGYIGYLDGMPCVPFDFTLNDPCFTAGPATLTVDALKFLFLVDQGPEDYQWDLQLVIENFWIEGRLGLKDSVPVIEQGIMHATLLGDKAINDLKSVIAAEYCQGHIDGCVPGSSDAMPACPDDDPGIKFFSSVPLECDVKVGTYSLRMVLSMAEAFGVTDMDVVGEVTSLVLPTSAAPVAGTVDPQLFSTDKGMNCQE